MHHIRDLGLPVSPRAFERPISAFSKGRRLSEQIKLERRSSELGQPVNPFAKATKHIEAVGIRLGGEFRPIQNL